MKRLVTAAVAATLGLAPVQATANSPATGSTIFLFEDLCFPDAYSANLLRDIQYELGAADQYTAVLVAKAWTRTDGSLASEPVLSAMIKAFLDYGDQFAILRFRALINNNGTMKGCDGLPYVYAIGYEE